MSVDNRELEEFQRKLADLKEQVPEFLRALALGEGVHAASEARRICKAEGIVNTGNYRENWHAGEPETAKTYTVVSGDCLWSICRRCYGDGSRYPELYEKNKDVIDAGNRGKSVPKYTIYPGQVFTL